MTRKIFSLGEFQISKDNPPVFFAEIGAFFGKDVGLAKTMITQIAEATSAVAHQPTILKTEILHDPDICLPGNTMETYAAKDGRVQQENYRALIERKVLPLDDYANLLRFCHDSGMAFVASVYDFAGADFAHQSGAVALKIASSNIVHVPLIRYCAQKGLPLILDTGRATLEEVCRAVEIIKEEGCERFVIEHSPDGHPALPKAHNLNILQTYLNTFDAPIGLSDHHVGVEMLYVAIGLGAHVLEKGVHVAPDDLDIDISHTMDINDLPHVLGTVYDCWQALGSSERDNSIPIDGVIGTSQRQCLVAKQDIIAGDTLSLEHVLFAFPCVGISVSDWDTVQHRRFVRPKRKGEPVHWTDLEPDPKMVQ